MSRSRSRFTNSLKAMGGEHEALPLAYHTLSHPIYLAGCLAGYQGGKVNEWERQLAVYEAELAACRSRVPWAINENHRKVLSHVLRVLDKQNLGLEEKDLVGLAYQVVRQIPKGLTRRGCGVGAGA